MPCRFTHPGDKIVAADWAQSPAGPETVGIFRPSDGKFYLNFDNAAGFADVEFAYGNSDKLPVAGSFGALPGGGHGSP